MDEQCAKLVGPSVPKGSSAGAVSTAGAERAEVPSLQNAGQDQWRVGIDGKTLQLDLSSLRILEARFTFRRGEPGSYVPNGLYAVNRRPNAYRGDAWYPPRGH